MWPDFAYFPTTQQHSSGQVAVVGFAGQDGSCQTTTSCQWAKPPGYSAARRYASRIRKRQKTLGANLREPAYPLCPQVTAGAGGWLPPLDPWQNKHHLLTFILMKDTPPESAKRHTEEISMRDSDFSLDLTSFLDQVLQPTECFAKLCTDSNHGAFIPNLPKGDFADFAVVVGALNSLSRRRLHEFADKLQTQVGEISVGQPKTYEVPDSVSRVVVNNKQ